MSNAGSAAREGLSRGDLNDIGNSYVTTSHSRQRELHVQRPYREKELLFEEQKEGQCDKNAVN